MPPEGTGSEISGTCIRTALLPAIGIWLAAGKLSGEKHIK